MEQYDYPLICRECHKDIGYIRCDYTQMIMPICIKCFRKNEPSIFQILLETLADIKEVRQFDEFIFNDAKHKGGGV